MNKIKPTGNRLLLKIIDNEIVPGGLYIPKGNSTRLLGQSSVGKIIEVGEGYWNETTKTFSDPCVLKIGQKVLVNSAAGLQINRDILRRFGIDKNAEDEYILIAENQIMGIIEENEAN